MVHEFQTKYGCELGLDMDDKMLCRALAQSLRTTLLWYSRNERLKSHFGVILEELAETFDAIAEGKGFLKESSDLLYTVYGLQHALGYCEVSEEAFRRVHESNMTKTPGNKSPTGKILKGPDYVAPDLEDLENE